jgi:hypothetical protein
MGEEPEEQAQTDAEEQAGHNWEVESGVFAAMDDVAGTAAETERQLAAEVEKSANEDEKAAEEEERAAEFAKGIHKWIVAELRVPEMEQTKRDSSATQVGIRAAQTPEKTGLLPSE